jgi:hypothetical protein
MEHRESDGGGIGGASQKSLKFELCYNKLILVKAKILREELTTITKVIMQALYKEV